MANLVISTRCDLSCTYCFARETLRASEAAAASPYISLEAYRERLDFLERSQIGEARLIGGEPTLHPRFPELVALARGRGLHIVVFTHGLIPEPALTCLEALPPDACTVLVNTNASRASAKRPTDEGRRRETLSRLGQRATVGYTIASPNFGADFLIPLVLETGCRRSIRLGLAQATVPAVNAFLHPKQYRAAGEKIAAFVWNAAEHGICVELDCGFVPCMFSAEALETLAQAKADAGWHCSPVLDVDLSSRVFPCFPLAGKIQTSFTPVREAEDFRSWFDERMRPYRLAGIYQECSTCPHKQQQTCPGGCLAATLRRFQTAGFQLTVPAHLLPR